jgi:hypothetical protein
MKKITAIVLVVFFGLGIIGGLFFLAFKNKKSSSSPLKPTPTPQQIMEELPTEELPLVWLTPSADKHEVTLEIKNIKNTNTLEYELTYLSKDIPRGVVGTINLKEGETSITRKILLGTCSRNVCKYDEGVTGGTLTLRLRGPEGLIKVTGEFDLQSKNRQIAVRGWKIK